VCPTPVSHLSLEAFRVPPWLHVAVTSQSRLDGLYVPWEQVYDAASSHLSFDVTYDPVLHCGFAWQTPKVVLYVYPVTQLFILESWHLSVDVFSVPPEAQVAAT